MAESSKGYTVESKQLTTAIGKCLGVIALGDRAESNNIVLLFSKRGLAVEAANSVASYRSDLVVDVGEPVAKKVSLLPEMLISYANSYPKLTLVPRNDHLMVKGGRGFTANIYYVGENEPIEIDKPDNSEDISGLSAMVNELLSTVGGMKNRTGKQELGAILNWGEGQLDMVVGDTHHVVVAEAPLKSKSAGNLTMALGNLRRIMEIGQNFVTDGPTLKAWSDTEYLTVDNQTDNVFLADTAKEALEAKRVAVATVKAEVFQQMVSVLTAAVEETALVTFDLSAEEIKGSISTHGGRAVKRDRPLSYKGKPRTISVSIHHLRDCLSTLKCKEIKLVVYGTMLSLEGNNGKYTIKSAMAATASI